MRRGLLVLAGLLAAAAFGACTSFGTSDDTPAGDGGSPDGATTDATSSDAPTKGDTGPGTDCPALHGSQGVRFGTFCIDATEATRAQYTQFLAEVPVDIINQPVGCATNASFVPSRDWPLVPGDEDQPVVGVDWCDAFAFCKWAGKRLCGQIGGGTLALADFADATKSEWYSACTEKGTRSFPYGKTYDPAACAGADNRPVGAGTDHVKSHPGCEGPPGVFDMSGNVYEWEDACASTAADAPCELRGGGFSELETALRCDTNGTQPRNSNQRWGIRCCSD